jgi:hypothetical protein
MNQDQGTNRKTLETIHRLNRQTGADEIYGYAFYCPGCKSAHVFNVVRDRPSGPLWTFNGNLEKPTFSPSLIVRFPHPPPQTCHLFVRNGQIEYLSDSCHELAGQTIDLPPFQW